MIKIITITWSHFDHFNIKDTPLYKSFSKHNNPENVVHFHFCRNHNLELEKEFKENLGEQSEYILYKIKKMHEKIHEVEADYIIFCDAMDVVCTKNVDILPEIFDLDNYIICSSEVNDWPKKEVRNTWPDYSDYRDFDDVNKVHLNSGVFMTSKKNYIAMLEHMINVLIPLKFKTLNDQGLFVYYYNNRVEPKIILDYSNLLVLSTYDRVYDLYHEKNGCLYQKFNGISPFFVHDNGTAWGGKLFADRFKLKNF